jgi:hypothetical protein
MACPRGFATAWHRNSQTLPVSASKPWMPFTDSDTNSFGSATAAIRHLTQPRRSGRSHTESGCGSIGSRYGGLDRTPLPISVGKSSGTRCR